LLKNESCQNFVLTISLCGGGIDEYTGENGAKIRRQKWPYAPTRADAPHACHTSSSPGWANLTRIPDDLTDVTNPDGGWRHHDVIMLSACQLASHVSWHVSITGPTCHDISREPSWAEPSLSCAVSRGIGSSVADPTCNPIWDWIWAVHQARIVLIKS
jgi:hypothetical protein